MGWHVFTGVVLLAALSTTYAVLTKPAGCGSTIGCYSDCDGTSCQFVVTWRSHGDHVDFTLSLDTASLGGQRYVSLGLSDDDKMGGDSVTSCIQKSQLGVELSKHYNEGSPRSSPILDEPQYGLSDIDTSAFNGVLSCSYNQTKASTNSKVFSLTSKWTLFVAIGLFEGGLQKQHDELPFISPQDVDFEKNDDISGTAKNIPVKVHGCLMLFAWMFCASIGIFLARFYKSLWPNSKLCSEKVWFAFHRTCMVSALLFCAAGFIVIFVEVREWSELNGHTTWQRAHPYMGVIVTFLALLNPIMAVFRPHPDEEYRYIFNWAHWFVGTGAHILAALTLILGVTLDKAFVPYDAVWLIVAWLAYQIIAVLLMELFECIVYDPQNRYYRDGALKEPQGSGVKKVVLVLHVIIITGFTVATIVVVAIN